MNSFFETEETHEARRENKGCNKMFCGVCDEECEEYNAYCSSCGRTSHYICGESKLCPKCTKMYHNVLRQKDNINKVILEYKQSNIKKKKIEYNGKYFIEEGIIKDILQKELTRHSQGMTLHRKQFEESGNRSKKQKDKMVKHLHKRFQTGYIAKLLGFKVCEDCGRIYG